jgi:dihydrodipicolinate synthase/N-acetylneuraminate lyase
MHNRMKAALVLAGRLPAGHVRPPLLPIEADEQALIRRALERSGLLAPARELLGAAGPFADRSG